MWLPHITLLQAAGLLIAAILIAGLYCKFFVQDEHDPKPAEVGELPKHWIRASNQNKRQREPFYKYLAIYGVAGIALIFFVLAWLAAAVASLVAAAILGVLYALSVLRDNYLSLTDPHRETLAQEGARFARQTQLEHGIGFRHGRGHFDTD